MVSRAGQANEAGSVHRRGVAVYLAAHGLAGKAIAAADPKSRTAVPKSLAFETAHATDDLLCTLTDGSRLFISAKRACGNDIHLSTTVEQWLKQLEDLRPCDRLVLATAEPKSIVKHLGHALRRRRDAPDSVFPASEATALDALRGLLAGALPESLERVLDAAVVLTIDAAHPGCPQRELAVAMLDGTVVEAGQGETVISHLEAQMHTDAGRAYSSDVSSWVDHLVGLGVEIAPDRSGPPARATRARQVAAGHYRERLSHLAGHVDLSLLAYDLEPLTVERLADDIQATLQRERSDDKDRSKALLMLARRLPRLFLVGLPGAGKSAAVDQLAARWVTEEDAPLPIVVRLGEVAKRCRQASDVSLITLCEVAAAHAPQSERTDLVVVLRDAALRGEAVLLLDGLDECLAQQTLVAQGLKGVLAELPTETGVLLTSRPNGSLAAKRLSLDVAQLATPRNLDDVLDLLLQHIAKSRVAATERDSWVADRAQRVREIRRSYADLSAVPLLAVLITLVLADDRSAAVPGTTAAVLKAAVTQTVSHWEQHRPELPPGFAARPTEDQLLIGFASIGVLLSERGGSPRVDVVTAITNAMVEHWELARGPAAEVARAIQWFWDDRVGVFVSNSTDHVEPRSRVFAEIGAAMWCPYRSADDLDRWVTTAVGNSDQHTALLLAADLDPRVVTALLAPHGDIAQRAGLAATARRNGARFDNGQTLTLLDQLGTVGQAADNNENKTAVWRWASEIARLVLPPEHDAHRMELLTTLTLGSVDLLVARCIAAFTSADSADRPLTADERADVMALLSTPLPPEPEPLVWISSGHLKLNPRSELFDAAGKAVACAAARLPELAPEAVDMIEAFARDAGVSNVEEIAKALAKYGHHLDAPRLEPETMAKIANMAQDFEEGHRIILTSAAALSTKPVSLTSFQRWRLPELCTLFDALSVVSNYLEDFWTATRKDTEDMRTHWLRVASLATGIDPAVVAAQARIALNSDEFRDLVGLLYIADKPQRVEWNLEQLGPSGPDDAIRLITSASDWIALTAVHLLWDRTDPALAERLSTLLPAVSPFRRFIVGILRWNVGESPGTQLVREYFASTDPALRRVAAAVSRNNCDQAMNDITSQALVDDDATIRAAAGVQTFDPPDGPPPRHWSCSRCSTFNKLPTEKCTHCERGSRPRPRRIE